MRENVYANSFAFSLEEVNIDPSTLLFHDIFVGSVPIVRTPVSCVFLRDYKTGFEPERGVQAYSLSLISL